MIATRTFALRDLIAFGQLSGDRNPLHIDPLAARRTQFGACAVHGVHMLLWALDKLAGYCRLDNFGALRVRFSQPVLVGEKLDLGIVRESDAELRAEVIVQGTVCVALTLRRTDGRQPSVAECAVKPPSREWPAEPVSVDIDSMKAVAGLLSFARDPAEIAIAFPALAQAIGPMRVAAFACITRLVGMVCPGLHSIFGGLDVLFTETEAPPYLHYRVDKIDTRFRTVQLGVWGGGLTGTVDAFVRHPPVMQPTMADLVGVLPADIFAGTWTLVIGGSRGLGEVAAKLIASGGGHVVITYSVGRADSERVAADIGAAGGRAELWQMDVRKPLAAQLGGLSITPTYACHFATPQIARRRAELFSDALLGEFLRFYVASFGELCSWLSSLGGSGKAVLYPSSVYVDARPKGLTEYAMAKAAGEILCADLGRSMRGLSIVATRLPRILTDQTATLMIGSSAAAVEALLPAIREMASRSSRTKSSS